LEEQLVELQAALQTIDELDENKEILLPISGGIFARAKLTTSNELMVNVGANVIVKKKNNETKELLDKRVVQVQEFHEQMTTGIQQLTAKLQVIATELQGQVDSQNV